MYIGVGVGYGIFGGYAMSRTKWTLESLNDVEDDEGSALPQLKEITRASLADPAFSAPEFLAEYSQFRTLKDVQQIVSEWERRLENELSSTVNSRFADFVGAVEATEHGVGPLTSVNADLARFSSHSEGLSAEMAKAESKISTELERHRALSTEEAKARKLLHLFDLLAELESAVPEVEIGDAAGMIVLAKSFVALKQIARTLPGAKAVSVLQVSIESVHRELTQKLDQAVNEGSEGKLDLLTAREFVLATNQVD